MEARHGKLWENGGDGLQRLTSCAGGTDAACAEGTRRAGFWFASAAFAIAEPRQHRFPGTARQPLEAARSPASGTTSHRVLRAAFDLPGIRAVAAGAMSRCGDVRTTAPLLDGDVGKTRFSADPRMRAASDLPDERRDLSRDRLAHRDRLGQFVPARRRQPRFGSGCLPAPAQVAAIELRGEPVQQAERVVAQTRARGITAR